MIKTILIIAAVLVVNLASGQGASSTETSDASNIYFQALKIYTENKLKGCACLLVEADEIITKKLPGKVGTCDIKYVDLAEITTLLEKESPLRIIRIFPIRFNRGEFYVVIIPFNVEKEGNDYQYANTGGHNIFFSYDSNSKSFQFLRID